MIPLTVFTPSHDPRFLNECWASLAAQTFGDFEWVVVLNGGAAWEPPTDARVRVVDAGHFLRGVGAAKAFACSLAVGDILIELDHDDILSSDALDEVVRTFDDPDVGFAYSDWAQIGADGEPDMSTWPEEFGWSYRGTAVDGRVVLSPNAFEPTPHNVSLIWYAPNHLRSFRRSVYEAAGGYNPDLDVLDDQDLMARLYQLAEFRHIGRCLYLQRVHEGMTQKRADLNPVIQTRTVELYDATIEANALEWARRRKLACLDLGGAHGSPAGYLSIDKRPDSPGLVGDVFDVLAGFSDSSAGVVRAMDFLEHVEDKVALLNEIHRVLAADGMLISRTPSTDGRGAWQDPTHVSFWNENSFWYFTDAAYAAYVPEITARFQASRLVSFFPTDFHREHNIPYVQANLIAVKPDQGNRNGGLLRW